MNKIINFVLLAMIFSNVATSQDVKFSISIPKVVSMGERFRITFSVNAKGTGFVSPDFKDFYASGPSISSNSSIQIINGQMSQTFSYAYVFYAEPKKPGDFVIGAAKIKVDGKTYETAPTKITVVGETTQEANEGNNNQVNTEEVKDLFVRIELNKTEGYVGEPVLATLKLYSRVDLTGFEDMKFPVYKGFWTQEVFSPKQINLERETVNGVIYNTGILKQELLYPQRAGELKIEQFEIDVVVGRQTFFGMQPAGVRKVVSSPRVYKAKQLPDSRPESFTGAVGKFDMKISVDKNSAKTNEAITLLVQISGTGNLKLVEPPRFSFPSDFESFDPKEASDIKNTASGSSGTKTFEYLLIPRVAGTFTIPPVEFSYFDPETKTFKKINGEQLTFTVEKGEGSDATVSENFVHKSDIQLIGQDIRYIRTMPFSVQKSDWYIFGTGLFYAAYLMPVLVLAAFFIFHRKKALDNANMNMVRNKKASEVSRKRLKKAQSVMADESSKQFFDELLIAMWGYLGDKLSMPVSDLSKDNVRVVLEKYMVQKNVIDQYLSIIEDAEFAKYAPAALVGTRTDLYQRAIEGINMMDSSLIKQK